MKRFLKWISVILGIFLILIFFIYIVISSLLDTEPVVYSNSYLHISLSGEIPEYVPHDGLEDLFEAKRIDMFMIRQSLKMAAVDERIKGVFLKINPLFTGYAKIQELQQLIADFRSSGKKIYAHMDIATTKEYYLATACDSIFIVPEGILLLTGIRAELTFYKGLFNKIGIDADFVHIGKYKNAPDSYTRQSMSDAQKEVINYIVDDRYHEIVSVIAKKRNLTSDKVDEIINQLSGLTPDESLENGLVDGQKYSSDVVELFSEERTPHKVSVSEYSRISPSSFELQDGPKVAVIYCSGTITGGSDNDDPILGQTMGAARVIRNINSAANRNSIKAIILRIDSPGGSGTASDNIWNALEKAKEKKPVIATISDIGASGGYYLAIGADTIISQPASIIGSIGVFAGKFSLEKLFKEWGINTEIVKRGKNANIFSLSSKFSKSERAVIHKIIYEFYKNFVEKVSQNRNMSYEEVHRIAQGRVWTGADGQHNGLIDTVGGMDTAIELAKQMTGISEDPGLVIYPRKKSIITKFLKNITYSSKNSLIMWEKIQQTIKEFELQPLALLPFQFNFR